MRGDFFGCCGWARTATASSTTTTRLDGTAAFPLRTPIGAIYHADRDEEKCDLRRKATGIRRVGNQIQPEIQLNDASVRLPGRLD
jgi:hypothetical protein